MSIKKQIIIVDIDGTIALKGSRHPHDFENVDKDKPNKKLLEIIEAILKSKPELGIIFVSGRMSSCRDKTITWIKKYCNSIIKESVNLIMREDNDFREDQDVKFELYQKIIESNYDVYLVFDDRNRVVEMWRSQGLTCYQVAAGDF